MYKKNFANKIIQLTKLLITVPITYFYLWKIYMLVIVILIFYGQ